MMTAWQIEAGLMHCSTIAKACKEVCKSNACANARTVG